MVAWFYYRTCCVDSVMRQEGGKDENIVGRGTDYGGSTDDKLCALWTQEKDLTHYSAVKCKVEESIR